VKRRRFAFTTGAGIVRAAPGHRVNPLATEKETRDRYGQNGQVNKERRCVARKTCDRVHLLLIDFQPSQRPRKTRIAHIGAKTTKKTVSRCSCVFMVTRCYSMPWPQRGRSLGPRALRGRRVSRTVISPPDSTPLPGFVKQQIQRIASRIIARISVKACPIQDGK